MRGQVIKDSLLYFLRHIIVLSLVLSVMAKPISTMLFQISEVKYELFDDFEEHESNDRESNIEQDKLSNFYDNYILTVLNTNHINNYFTTKKNIMNFKLEIQLPPPKL